MDAKKEKPIVRETMSFSDPINLTYILTFVQDLFAQID